MTAKSGTPMIMPTKPHRPPNSRMANSTQKLESPVVLPRIFGPMMLPSTCCRTRTNRTNQSALMGFWMRMSKVAGMAPMKGPKKGMTLVTPMMTETSSALGNLKMRQAM